MLWLSDRASVRTHHVGPEDDGDPLEAWAPAEEDEEWVRRSCQKTFGRAPSVEEWRWACRRWRSAHMAEALVFELMI